MGRGPVGAPAIIRYVNNSLASVDDVSGIDGDMVLIKTVTASSSSTVDFVDGTSDVVLDNTYPIYLFKIINAHPGTDDVAFQFQANAAEPIEDFQLICLTLPANDPLNLAKTYSKIFLMTQT